MYKENDYVPNSTILDGFYFLKGSLLNYCLIIVFFGFRDHTHAPSISPHQVLTCMLCMSLHFVSFFFISFFLSLGANDFYTFDQSIAQVCIHLYIF